ncbi:hypothetical protein NE237_020781 [Protea cynaroides]|uniref:Uncharacterized protein n=1 Tax=Protea cynaroides TaxID=273540 RepID=A0A9Q0K2M5_9MAGN|nr:hypothetical protein NE237_020781 [Protea cynaroides]
MLRACALDFKGGWDEKLSLIEFTYNNSYQATIQMAPYEALYGRKCRTPLLWNEVGERRIVGPEFVEETYRVIDQIKERVSPVRGLKRFGKKGKLCPSRKVQQLQTKDIHYVKVHWRSQNVEKITWEEENAMRKEYPNLFDDQGLCDISFGSCDVEQVIERASGYTVDDYVNAPAYGGVAALDVQAGEDEHDASCECPFCVYL